MSNKKQHDEEHSKIYKVWLWIKQWWLPIAILLITSIGLACALSIPQQVFKTPSNLIGDKSAPILLAQSNLRLAFLYITGGAIAVMGLIETFRKNNNEKLKNDQEKEKNDRDHLRQVRAERRERYTKAVEQLGDKEAPVRMGGVYSLVRLVDEWLEDESIEKYEDRLKEGQVIINNLCAYIRSPFTLTSNFYELSQASPTGSYEDKKQEFYTDKATLDSEADVRLGIIKEIHDRLQGSGKNTPGAWSDFEYDFSGSTFFYPIDFTNSYYTKPINFSGSTYQGRVDFGGSTYREEVDFSSSTYQGRVDFGGSIYQEEVDFSSSTYSWADFSSSTYQEWVDFGGSTYREEVDFSGSTYTGGANFSGSTYTGGANLHDSVYKRGADFRNSTYQDPADFRNSTYQDPADFSGSTYQSWANFRGSIYQGGANFRGSTYQGGANFYDSTYQGGANFRGSTYQGGANFHDSTYKGEADFRGSTYTGGANFHDSTYKGSANFSRSTYTKQVNFSGSAYQEWTDFSGSIFYQETYFGKNKYSVSYSNFTHYTPSFYDEIYHKNTLFGSITNDFTIDKNKGYPINLNSEGIPIKCEFLTSGQKKYLEDNFQEIEKINNRLLEVKDPKENVRLLDTLHSLNEELHEWREEATTVKVEDDVAEDTEN